MAFVVEDGTGKSDANSYLSVADADSYHADHSASASWTAATTEQKEKALRLATQYLDARYDGRWRGYQNTSTQALAWPRTSAVDNEGYVYDNDAVPQRLEDATAELALRVITGDTLYADQTKAARVASSSVTVGPISKSVSYVGGLDPAKKYPLIEALMTPLIAGVGSLERG